MKKILLSLFAFAIATVSAFAGDNLVENSGFETWENGVATGWKSTTSASNATVSQSEDAHAGSYAILVQAGGSSNKRLASKEYTLKAGTYTITAYVKGGGQCKLGYVPSTDGQVGNYNYEKNYFTTSADEWTEHSFDFTLDATTTVNILVFNPKTNDKQNYTSTDLLVDDVTLTTEDGGIADTPDPTPTPDPAGDGTLANPYNAIAATNAAAALASGKTSDADVYIKGIVSNVKYAYDLAHGTATFSISEDGKSANSFLCYSVLYLDNAKYADESKANIQVGDQVVICGKLTNYKGTYETASGKAYLYSLNGIVTGINNATIAPAAKQTIYSIDGRKLTKLVKGVNIVNGKKVIK